MGRARQFTVFLVLGLACLPGAEVVVPGRYAAAEAPSYTLIPFGRMGSVRLQQVYEGWLFPGGVLTLTALAARPDQDGSALAKNDLDLEILLGAGGAGVTGLSQNFASNRPAAMTLAFQRRTVALPAQNPGVGPMPFSMLFVLDAPFPYSGSSGPLLVEMVVHDQSGSGHSCDAPYLSPSARSDFGPPGCRGSNGLVPAARCQTASVHWGEKVQLEVERLRPDAAVVLALGASASGGWGGVPLPFDLTPLGAPGCSVSLAYAMLAAGKAGPSGRADFVFQLPASPRFVGQWVLFQGIALDPAANPFGASFSAGHQVQVSGPEAVGRVYHFDLSARDGLAQVGLAHVLKFLTP